MRKAGALLNEAILGAGEVRNILSEPVLDPGLAAKFSSDREAVGIAGPGAVSNGSLQSVGHDTGVAFRSKHCVMVLPVRAMEERAAAYVWEDIVVLDGHPSPLQAARTLLVVTGSHRAVLPSSSEQVVDADAELFAKLESEGMATILILVGQAM